MDSERGALDLYQYYLPGVALAMLAFGLVRLGSLELQIVLGISSLLFGRQVLRGQLRGPLMPMFRAFALASKPERIAFFSATTASGAFLASLL